MSPTKRTLGAIAAASVAVLAAVAPAAHATPTRTAAPVTTAAAKNCSEWVELKWPNGTGTGVWVRVCS